ncbi:hypothetical protein L9F63_010563 [Diploptera punctata]|uniref:Uncharacterized protein n=1 Tax=Diploptera punctata TaxID=6984 RepID=A0AAD8AH68_DIPPU|nr:hypothetical protein L9F63_010563 [Diploptera punctata]
MRLLILVAVVLSARGQAVPWSLHLREPDNHIMVDSGILTTPTSKALSLHRLLSIPDIYRTPPELAHLYSDSEEGEGVELPDLRYSPHLVDPDTDTETWSRADVGTDPELLTGEHSECELCNYDSTSSSSLELSPPEENDEMKPLIRPSQIKRKQTTSRSNQYGGRYKRETGDADQGEEIEKKAFSSWGGKRAPAFNSWGGKRNPAFSVLGSIRRRAFTSVGSRRSPAFNSWGGKRSNSFSIVGDTHPLLNSWGGKSNPTFSTSSSEGNPAFTLLGNKRQSSFHSWGGKRDPAFNLLSGHQEPAFKIIGGGNNEPAFSIIPDKTEPAFKILGNHDFPAFSVLSDKYEPAFSVLAEKRSPAFNSWGGKRDPAFNSWGGKRDPAFNSWGGKRDPAFNSWGGKRDPAFNSWGGKRDPAFNSWGGKRDPAFNSWGGKRDAAFSSWGGKRNEEISDLSKRDSKFSSWGGKRDSDGDEKRSFSSWGGKRDLSDSPKRSFSSWGGKRTAATQTEEENHRDNSTGAKEVTDDEIHPDQFKEKEDEEEKDKEEPNVEVNESDKEEDNRKHLGTQTSLDFQQFLQEFDNKMQLDDEQKQENNLDEKEVAGGETTETSGKVDINMDHEAIGMDEKYIDTTNTEEKGVGTSDSLVISKRNTARSGTRISKAMFNPWGGKRNSKTQSLFSVLASMSRGVGRSDGFLSDLLYKRGSSRHSSLGSKKWGQASSGAVFSSWGGKRSDKASNLRKLSPQNMGRQYRRGADFYSWGGKR